LGKTTGRKGGKNKEENFPSKIALCLPTSSQKQDQKEKKKKGGKRGKKGRK